MITAKILSEIISNDTEILIIKHDYSPISKHKHLAKHENTVMLIKL